MKKFIAIIIAIAMVMGAAPSASALRPMAKENQAVPLLQSMDLELAKQIISQLKKEEPCPYVEAIIERLLQEKPANGVVLNPDTYTPGLFRFSEIGNIKVKGSEAWLLDTYKNSVNKRAEDILEKILAAQAKGDMKLDPDFVQFLQENLVEAITNLLDVPQVSELTHPQLEEVIFIIVRLFCWDVYKTAKEASNQKGEAYYIPLRERITETKRDRGFNEALHQAICFSAVGNGLEIKYHREELINFDNTAERSVEINDFFNELDAKLKPGKGKISFYLDNAGEIFTDLLIVELLLDAGFDVVLVAKDKPASDDLTYEDTEVLLARLMQSNKPEYRWLRKYYDIQKPAAGRLRVASSGSATPATDLNKLPKEETKSIFNMYKGGGNQYGIYPASLPVDAFIFLWPKNLFR